ncbi:MAG TPA: hypothetical protein VFC25_06315 [Verrucomicrobiae bacterium]|nr:hypothetical protein [Verrucomicrobiae bacterium]
MSEPLRLADDDRQLLEDVRGLLQRVTALLRDVLAALPRPVPPGDWGRSSPPEGAMPPALQRRDPR